MERQAPLGRAFWIGLTIGGAVVLFGLAGFIRNRTQTDPGSSLKFLVGALIAHDALWAWAVAGVSFALVRVVPRRVRGIVMGAIATSVVLLLVATPALTGEGRLPNNPSILPRDYGDGLLIAVTVVWGVAALLALRALRRPARAVDAERRPTFPDRAPGW